MPDLGRSGGRTERIWTCKIGGPVDGLPSGADFPMREIVEAGYLAVTGTRPAFTFSGWGGELAKPERAVVEDRLPDPAKCETPLRGQSER